MTYSINCTKQYQSFASSLMKNYLHRCQQQKCKWVNEGKNEILTSSAHVMCIIVWKVLSKDLYPSWINFPASCNHFCEKLKCSFLCVHFNSYRCNVQDVFLPVTVWEIFENSQHKYPRHKFFWKTFLWKAKRLLYWDDLDILLGSMIINSKK